MNKNENFGPEADGPRGLYDEQIGNALKGELMPSCPSGLHQRVRDRISQLKFQSTRNRALVVVGLLACCMLSGALLSWWNPSNQFTKGSDNLLVESQVSYTEFEALIDPPAFTVVRFVEVQQSALLGSLGEEEQENAVK